MWPYKYPSHVLLYFLSIQLLLPQPVVIRGHREVVPKLIFLHFGMANCLLEIQQLEHVCPKRILNEKESKL
ncbi:hypothetical protein BpHYR1_037544 [Brachionus plicatilis]|uniref:Uncharacterized protein n=1 Tax=Brachionus plicatilis TaxID=10195 RepID=A0A3M7RZH7_BRAPC|nr:hypothetical protein BpHYR1_037544 [Brachionus plicatilis]